MMQALNLSSSIDAAREFIAETNGMVHVDDVLYPLFIQALYPNRSPEIESFIELLYQIWLDPSPEHIVFLPEFMQDRFVRLPDFIEVVSHVYPVDHYERIAFLAFMSTSETGFPGVTDSSPKDVESVSTGIQKKELDPGSVPCGLVREASSKIASFAKETKIKQRQMLLDQGVRIVGIEEAVDHEGPHMAVLTYQQKIPIYQGETCSILIEEQKSIVSAPKLDCHPRQERSSRPRTHLLLGMPDHTCDAQNNLDCYFNAGNGSSVASSPLAEDDRPHLPTVLAITSIKFLFNDPELFYERYVLNVRQPYQPMHHISAKALKDFLLLDKPIQAKTAFDQHQIDTMKQGWDAFKATLPKDVIWNKQVLYDVPDTKQTLHGIIDLVWDGGLYQITKKAPPGRSALLNGLEPELPLLAAAYQHGFPGVTGSSVKRVEPVSTGIQNASLDPGSAAFGLVRETSSLAAAFPGVTHIGYIQIKGHGEDAITITRYNDPSVLASENIKKLEHILSHNHSRPQEEPA